MPSVDVYLPRAWDTACAALTACANALGDSRSVAEISGWSALAFRTSVDKEISLMGPHAYPWREVLTDAAARLGYECVVVTGSEPPSSELHRVARASALALIAAGGQQERPTMIWGVHAPEFGLARGTDFRGWLEISGILDGMGPRSMSPSELGTGDVPVVFALQLTKRLEIAERNRGRAALRAAVLFGRGPAPSLSGFENGLAAWSAMSAALESGVIDPSGLAYSAQRYAEARTSGAAWLGVVGPIVGLDLSKAETAFSRSAGMLRELAGCHPFPPPPSWMLTNTMRDQAHALVMEVLHAEEEGLDALREALRGCLKIL